MTNKPEYRHEHSEYLTYWHKNNSIEKRLATNKKISESQKKRHAMKTEAQKIETRKKKQSTYKRTRTSLKSYEVREYAKYLRKWIWDHVSPEGLERHAKMCGAAVKKSWEDRTKPANLNRGFIGRRNMYAEYHEVDVPRVVDYCGVVTENKLANG